MFDKEKLKNKFKKKLKAFLTDESGKITKKDALGLAALGSSISFISEVESSTVCIDINDHSSGGSSHNSSFSEKYYVDTVNKTSHASWLVNWHYSVTPNWWTAYEKTDSFTTMNAGEDAYIKHSSHGSHGSHWSHGSHGSHWSHGSHGSHWSHGSRW